MAWIENASYLISVLVKEIFGRSVELKLDPYKDNSSNAESNEGDIDE